jgi:hypothetical protein
VYQVALSRVYNTIITGLRIVNVYATVFGADPESPFRIFVNARHNFVVKRLAAFAFIAEVHDILTAGIKIINPSRVGTNPNVVVAIFEDWPNGIVGNA